MLNLYGSNLYWILDLNIQGGIINKKKNLEFLLHNLNIWIICLNDHWLDKSSIWLLNGIPNCTLASFFCREENPHGGSCIIIKMAWILSREMTFGF